ncbi:phosphoserine phosphatase [Zalerion maritima]|uniref:Phosphoserine phosphatase n=1 Tax=Zalerion maritima TaxID=339359 RepID=A0AAD5WP58_9PEZI|nr:phosphoserine phosphatase [Zalerion maritima]
MTIESTHPGPSPIATRLPNTTTTKTSSLPPAMRSVPPPKYIFFTDFDGTITRQDSNDHLTDNYGFGHPRRRALNLEVLSGAKQFRDCFWEMLESVSMPFSECVGVLEENIELDEGFREFWGWCKGGRRDAAPQEVPIVVLSGGMRPIILALLGKLLGLSEDEKARLGMEEGMLVSNDVGVKEGYRSVEEENGWEIVFHDESEHGHDKSLELRKYSSLPDRPIMFYAGDGVSDLSAARETDLLFAKEGCDLVNYCEKQNIPFRTFRDFRDITATVKEIVNGRLSMRDAATGRQVWE